MTEKTQTEVEAVADLVVGLDPMHYMNGRPFLVLPQGYYSEDLHKWLPAPTRHAGKNVLNDVDSFCRFVMQQKGEMTRIYGTYDPPAFLAVFNDTVGPLTGWCDHIATYSCPLSVEWKTWIGSNKKPMTQQDFAQFIEDNAPDCVLPDSATMIEVARTLEAKKSVNFASGIRLDNGETQFTYEETVQGTAGKGRIQLPEVFTIAIQVFEGIGVPKSEIRARLRYRIANEGKLSLWYDLERPHKDLEAAAVDVWKAIEANTGLTIFNGC